MKNLANKSRWTSLIIAALSIVVLSVERGDSQTTAPLIEQPVVLKAVVPIFPATAVATNTAGTVVVEVAMDTVGDVRSVRSVSGHPLLRKSAEDAARRWRFAPAALVRIAQLAFTFSLMPKDTPIEDLTPVFTPPYHIEVRHQPYGPIIHVDPRSDEHRMRKEEKVKKPTA